MSAPDRSTIALGPRCGTACRPASRATRLGTHPGYGILGLVCLAALAGCSALDLRGKLPWSGSSPKPQDPTRMVDVWTDEVLNQPGLPPVRGFGGRVMFYRGDDNTPITVDGTLTVLAFDEADRENPQAVAERKFVYLPEHLPKYHRKSELGHSYNFWLPWDEVGGPERKLCLVVRFEPRSATGVLVSKPCQKTLPGVPPEPGQPGRATLRITRSTTPGGVQRASYEAPSREEEPEQGMTILTLDVPRSLTRPDPQTTATPVQTADRPAKTPPAASPSQAEARPAAAAEVSPRDRYARQRFPARRGLDARATTDPARRQPLPAAPLSALPPTPRSGWSGQTPASNAADESAPP